jgi:1-acyl-sn-glycerol-3-phosphate acyltransferase
MSGAYRFCNAVGRFICFCTIRKVVIRPEAAARPGPLLIACTHLSHLDPLLLSVCVGRPIGWVTRIEFYRFKLISRLLRALDTIPVRRFGVPVSTIRKSLARLAQSRIVGICPEGGVTQGASSVMRGGRIKRGVCLIACRSGVPVLPCVMLGTDKLNRVAPWLPVRRARVWLAFGDRCVEPPKNEPDRRRARARMAEELEGEFRKIFHELIETCQIAEDSVP